MDLGKSVYRVKQQLQKEGISGLAFDVDDTLTQTSNAFYNLLVEKFPPSSELTKDQVRKHYALTGNVMYWENNPEALSYVTSLIDSPYFHETFLTMPGAEVGMQKLDQNNLVGCYHTAREESMRESTERSLQSFPNRPIIMRPEHINHEDQAQWKAEVVEYLFPEIQGLVDNDTRVIRSLEDREFPGKIFLFGLNENEYKPTNTTTPVESWQELTKIILNTYPEQ